MTNSTYMYLLVAGALVGCNDDVTSGSPASNVSRTHFVSADSVSTVPLATLKSFASMAGQSDISNLVRYGVTTFRVVYETAYNGKPIRASGLIYIPENSQGRHPLVSLQHGTTFLKDRAPTTTGDFTGMEYFASAGYIAVMPDYIGYGESAAIFHPYYDESHSATSVIDFIKAAKEFISTQGIALNNQLFLAGYSEGGYVTLATARELELNPTHDLNVTAVAAGAGGYDLNEMLKAVSTGTHYAYPAYLAFVIAAYNKTYGWNKPYSYFFQERYARALESTMDGGYDGWQINSRLTTDLERLLNPEFLSGLRAPEGEPQFKKALAENSVNGWRSMLPIRLFHGTRDEIIPYQNSEEILRQFRAAGSEDVALTLIQGGSHGSAFIPMLQKFVPWFETIRKK